MTCTYESSLNTDVVKSDVAIRAPGRAVTLSLKYSEIVNVTLDVSVAISGKNRFDSTYAPGPQAGSLSGQYMRTPRIGDCERSTKLSGSISLVRKLVLSKTACCGNPDDV